MLLWLGMCGSGSLTRTGRAKLGGLPPPFHDPLHLIWVKAHGTNAMAPFGPTTSAPPSG